MPAQHEYDLIIVGSGAAGLAAAVTYVENQPEPRARIALLERSSRKDRGGATRWTGAFLRIQENRKLDPDYPDLLSRVSGGRSDTAYVRKLVEEVPATLKFIEDRGVKLMFPQLPLPHSFDSGRASLIPPGMPMGGGKSIVEALSAVLERYRSVDFLYGTEAVRLTSTEDGQVNGVVVRGSDGLQHTLSGRAVLLACGGFEGNPEMLSRYIGPNACDLPLLAPGLANNRGDGIRMAMDIGADTAGQFDMIHAEPTDVRSDQPDAVLYGYPTGIFVNERCERFFDEGSDTWDNTFEKVGYEIWRNQNQKAYWIADAHTLAIPGIENLFLSNLAPEQADTLQELATKLGLDPEKLDKSVAQFNAAVAEGTFDPTVRDGKKTVGLVPPKSNWASPLDEGPYIGFPLTAKICFTYGGLRTDLDGRVVTASSIPIPGLYAAGEITGLYYHEYPPATSVLRSLTFGRLAAQHALASVR